jgi:hypothetical protein
MLLLVCAAGLLAGAPLAAARIGSSSTPLSARALPIGGPCDISTHCWAADARDFDGQNDARIVYICPSYGSAYAGIFGVWGTDVYSDNSSVCTAAVHAGKIAPTSGGIVTIEIRPGQIFYKGSTRNGITSGDAGSRVNSFVVVDASPGNPPSAGIGLDGWSARATDFRTLIGARFTYTCPANGTPRTVLGTGVYEDDSFVCTAAVHAGRITLAKGGNVTIEMRPGQDSYKGSMRNGISSESFRSGDGSFVVVGAGGAAPTPTGTASGTVLVNGQPFTGGTIPYGSTVDVTSGTLTMKTDVGTLAVYSDGVNPAHAVLKRTSERVGKKKQPLVQLALTGGDFTACTPRKTSARAPGSGQKPKPKPVRSLWGKGKGHFRTKGRYSSATVRGTEWLTTDRCDGTLTTVKQGVVSVYDYAKKKKITVGAGRSYLAQPRK